MTDLKTLIDRLDAPDDWDSIVLRSPSSSLPDVDARRTTRNDRMRRATIAVFSMSVAAFAILFVIRAFETSPPSRSIEEVGDLVVEAKIPLDPGITDVGVGGGSVWVAGSSGVTRVDAETNRVLARIPVPGTGDHSRVTIGEGSVWITAPELRDDGSRGNLVRIDPATNEIEATFEIGGPITGLGVGGGSVWVTIPGIGPGSLLRIDPATGRVLDRVQVGGSPGSPVYGYGFVWVAGTDLLTKIDPATATVVDELSIPDVQASGVASLWGVGPDSVVRFDPESGQVEATVSLPRAAAVSVDAEMVWVLASPRSSDPTLFYPIRGTAVVQRIDPATNALVGESLHLDDLQPIAMSADSGRLWVADFDSGFITRIAIRPG